MGTDNPRDVQEVQQLLFEYEQLRKEVLQNQTISHQLLGGAVVIMGTLITLATSAAVTAPVGRVMFIIIAELIAVVSTLQSIDKENTTFLIASYLRTFVEPALPRVKWESRLHALRQRRQRSGNTGAAGLESYHRFTRHSLWTYAGLCLIAFGVGMYYVFTAMRDWTGVVAGVALVLPLAAIVWLEFKRSDDLAALGDRMAEDWQSVAQRGEREVVEQQPDSPGIEGW